MKLMEAFMMNFSLRTLRKALAANELGAGLAAISKSIKVVIGLKQNGSNLTYLD